MRICFIIDQTFLFRGILGLKQGYSATDYTLYLATLYPVCMILIYPTEENLYSSLFPHAQLLGLVALLLAVGVVVPLGELVAPVLQRLPDDGADAAVAEGRLRLDALVDQLQPEPARRSGAAVEATDLQRGDSDVMSEKYNVKRLMNISRELLINAMDPKHCVRAAILGYLTNTGKLKDAAIKAIVGTGDSIKKIERLGRAEKVSGAVLPNAGIQHDIRVSST